MKKLIVLCALTVTTSAIAQQNATTVVKATENATEAKKPAEPVMTKEKGVYVINTTTLCDTKGYKSTTPLKVTIKKDKIEKVEALPNTETPKYFRRINTELLPKFAGMKLEDYAKVDALTGATMSSNAIKDNMKAASEYYKANK